MFKELTLKYLYHLLKRKYEVKYKLKQDLYIAPNMVMEFNYIFGNIDHEETGGLLFGKVTKDGILIDYILPVENEAENKTDEFKFTFAKLNPTILKLRAQGYKLIGEFHTHPSGKCEASKQDHKTMSRKAEVCEGIYILLICTAINDIKKRVLLQNYKVYTYI